MARKTSKTQAAPKYGIFRGEAYAVPLYDLDGNFARFDTIDAAMEALPALVADEERMAARWGFTPAKLIVRTF